MHGTEPAETPTERCPTATVIDISAHLPTTPPEPVLDPDMTAIAAFWQGQYDGHGLSLADPDTATAHRCALDTLALLIKGSLHTGRLAPEAHDHLIDLITQAKAAPEAV